LKDSTPRDGIPASDSRIAVAAYGR
jgi:hypothetical protein